MVVKVVGEGRVVRRAPSVLEDPDPQQLVMSWDQEARLKRAAAKAKAAGKAAKAGTEAAGARKASSPAESKKAPRATGSAAKPAVKSPAGKGSTSKPAAKASPAKPAAKTSPAKPAAKASSAEPSTKVAPKAPRRKAAPAEKTPRTRSAVEPTGRMPAASRAAQRSLDLLDAESPKTRKPAGARRGAAIAPALDPVSVETSGPAADGFAGATIRLAAPSSIPANGAGLPSGNGSGRNGHGSGNGSVDSGEYTGDQIQILEGVQHIRQRPGMYIGTTSTSGLLHLIYEAIDNVVDEFNAGFGSQMWITIDRDGRVTVRDEARGIPIDMKEWGGATLPTATWIFIKPFTGGKFEPGAYKQAGGLHGVGLTVINALSAELEVDIWRDGQHFQQRFREGQALDYRFEPCDPALHGTQIRWMPDPAVFDEDATYDVETLVSRLQATACLNRGLRIELSYWDEETRRMARHVLHSQNGLADYLKMLETAGPGALFRHPISIVKTKDDVFVEVVLQPDKGYKTQMLSFANGVRTPDGGTHEIGFRAALTKMVNDYALKWNLIKDRSKDALKPDVIQQGLAVVISVKLADPQFQGQTKNRLNNAPVEGIVRSVVSEGLAEWFETNQSQAREWLKKIHLAQKARNEAQMAEELARTGQKRGSELVDVVLSKKFAACNGNDPERNELFLVEGESAGGSAKQARKSEFQAILALKGKPLNVANASLQRILDNEEIRTIISVIGTGTRHLFDIEKLKFHKIIILSDADVDGSHIVCLLLTLFHQEMPGLIEAGHVYLGCPPLYSVKYKGKTIWLTDDEARKKFLREHPDAAGLEFKRYKGLGEMNASELRETTMDPAKRVLKRVTMEDSALASKWVSDLMAKENAEARRALLRKQARHLAAAGNLDV
ncbi:MAG: toprim domain-containing protein [Sphingomonadaceae bacterium]